MEKAFPWILLAEVALPLLFLVILLAVLLWRARRNDVRGVRALINKVQAKDASRKAALQDFLSRRMGFEEPDLSQRLSLIDSQRKAYYKALLQSFMRHDAELVAGLDEPLDAYIDAYHVLAHQGPAASPAPAPSIAAPVVAESGNQDAEIAALKRENKRLRQEAQITLGTLNNIFAEYTSMFGEQTERTDMSVEEIIEAMEKYSGRIGGQEAGDEAIKEEEEAYIRGASADAEEAESLAEEPPRPLREDEPEPLLAEMPSPEPSASELSEQEAMAAAWEASLLGDEPEDEPAQEPALLEAEEPEPALMEPPPALFDLPAEEPPAPPPPVHEEPEENEDSMIPDDLDLLFQKAKEDAERNS
ncbi:MAG: hypothetical protein HYV16_00695 [Gammaproteobacteria bacterium]|nr:hypothetical protein [Gammaproteobacteria bacterium]